MSRGLSRDTMPMAMPSGVRGLRTRLDTTVYFFVHSRLLPMCRSTSVDTFFMPAMLSISASVRRGLPRTALATMRLGSRIRIDRSSREPFRAATTFSAVLSR